MRLLYCSWFIVSSSSSPCLLYLDQHVLCMHMQKYQSPMLFFLGPHTGKFFTTTACTTTTATTITGSISRRNHSQDIGPQGCGILNGSDTGRKRIGDIQVLSAPSWLRLLNGCHLHANARWTHSCHLGALDLIITSQFGGPSGIPNIGILFHSILCQGDNFGMKFRFIEQGLNGFAFFGQASSIWRVGWQNPPIGKGHFIIQFHQFVQVGILQREFFERGLHFGHYCFGSNVQSIQILDGTSQIQIVSTFGWKLNGNCQCDTSIIFTENGFQFNLIFSDANHFDLFNVLNPNASFGRGKGCCQSGKGTHASTVLGEGHGHFQTFRWTGINAHFGFNSHIGGNKSRSCIRFIRILSVPAIDYSI
mmetsp:Transcript_35484/g.86019  ORF Transcript_35484/g.86019 Transcript_35484/m.86019 type:complete len:363 (-) Transcript_35484:305-1393(-)